MRLCFNESSMNKQLKSCSGLGSSYFLSIQFKANTERDSVLQGHAANLATNKENGI